MRSLPSTDLDVNLVGLAARDAIAPHRNDALEVLVVAVGGRGTVRIDGAAHEHPGAGRGGGAEEVRLQLR